MDFPSERTSKGSMYNPTTECSPLNKASKYNLLRKQIYSTTLKGYLGHPSGEALNVLCRI